MEYKYPGVAFMQRQNFKILSIVLLILISCFNYIYTHETFGKESQDIDLKTIENDAQNDVIPDKITRALTTRGVTSEWIDTFDDNSKVSASNDVIISNGRVKIQADSGIYRNAGNIVSTQLSPPGDINWQRFHANISGHTYKCAITIDNSLNSNSLYDYQINLKLNTSKN